MYADLDTPSDIPAVASNLATILTRVHTVAFGWEEYQSVAAFFQKKSLNSMRKRYCYDLQVNTTIVEGVEAIRISSRNYGYEFLLVKVSAEPEAHGESEYVMHIYRSVLGENDYELLGAASQLPRALEMIDRMYCQAADLHLA
jgi:hypothetical protein